MGLVKWICTLSPQRIILGGGVMRQAGLARRIRGEVVALPNGYIQAPEMLEHIDAYIVQPALGANAGVLGRYGAGRRGMRVNRILKGGGRPRHYGREKCPFQTRVSITNAAN